MLKSTEAVQPDVGKGDRRPIVTAGDFNFWPVERGRQLASPRESSLLEALAKLNVDIANADATARIVGKIERRVHHLRHFLHSCIDESD